MEDDLKKNGRHIKKWKTTSQKYVRRPAKKVENDLQKNVRG